MDPNFQNTIIVGKGNLGSHITLLFDSVNVKYQHWSFKKFVSQFDEIHSNMTLWLCIPDHVVLRSIPHLMSTSCQIVYCSGAIQLEELWKPSVLVWYPLYSFNKNRTVDWKKIPVLTEAYSERSRDYLDQLNACLHLNTSECDSTTRLKLHLSAVFVNNFLNSLLMAVEEFMPSNKSEWIMHLLPIAEQTLERWKEDKAVCLQTGPAVRNDFVTMKKHQEVLNDFPLEQNVYKVLTDYIIAKIQQKITQSDDL